MTTQEAKDSIDKIIGKARVHFYKPIQIAEILYRSRVHGDLIPNQLETYRTRSRAWRDVVCQEFIGRVSTSSARYQDDVFNDNAVPPAAITVLDTVNKRTRGAVEKYIYEQFKGRQSQLSSGVEYCDSHDSTDFSLREFIDLFWHEAGLRRSIDKVYEIIVYSLFSTIIDELQVTINVSYPDDKIDFLRYFEEFTKKVIGLDSTNNHIQTTATINRVGVTNAADRGLDMWSNFGTAIQIKHLSLTEELAEDITKTVTSDRIVIVCKDTEERIIISLLTQIGWKARIQSVVVESELVDWYERALRGDYAEALGDVLLKTLRDEIINEFPSSLGENFDEFMQQRGYPDLDDDWV